MQFAILFWYQALLNLASAGPAAHLFLIVGPGWSCRWRLCRSDRTLNTLTLIKNYVKFDATKHNILGLKMFVVHAEINMFDSHLNLFGCKINSYTIFIKSIHVVILFLFFMKHYVGTMVAYLLARYYFRSFSYMFCLCAISKMRTIVHF